MPQLQHLLCVETEVLGLDGGHTHTGTGGEGLGRGVATLLVYAYSLHTLLPFTHHDQTTPMHATPIYTPCPSYTHLQPIPKPCTCNTLHTLYPITHPAHAAPNHAAFPSYTRSHTLRTLHPFPHSANAKPFHSHKLSTPCPSNIIPLHVRQKRGKP